MDCRHKYWSLVMDALAMEMEMEIEMAAKVGDGDGDGIDTGKVTQGMATINPYHSLQRLVEPKDQVCV